MPAIRLREAQSSTLDEHIALIRSVIRRSMRDPQARMLAVKIVSGSTDITSDPKTGKRIETVEAWGKNFRAPEGPTCPSRDDDCEVERIWDFLVLNVRYVYDAAEYDTFQTLRVTMETGGADCDDYTIAFATLLKHLGFHVFARVISTKDAPDQWVHIYPIVGIPKDNPRKWVVLDATVDGFIPGDEYHDIAKKQDFQL